MKDAYQNDDNSENENFQRIFSVIMIENIIKSFLVLLNFASFFN